MIPSAVTARRTLVVVAALALLVSGPTTTAVPAASAPPPDPVGPARTPAAMTVTDGAPAGDYRITLVTGDRVALSVDAAGRYEAAIDHWADRPGRSTQPQYQSFAGPDGVFVIPDDAQPAISSGLLDRSLFDVAYLAGHGFADDRTRELPVLVEYAGTAVRGTAKAAESTLRARADAVPASRTTAVLPSVGGAGLAVPKAQAGTFWQAIVGTAAARSATAGIEKVWLDRKVEATLDESVPLIGAPDAWAAGYDGTGVTVAVLDTGVDDTHPDLQGKVVAAKSFVGGTAKDGHGHGTHVAATVAGTGAGSTGRFKGVAPGADLAIGKVLSDTGSGTISGIIDGMEWATQEAGADIVSLSLGSGPSDGTDVGSQAVNALTASTGALFVIAAGNDGPEAGSVSAPGVADAALSVAATDKQDHLAVFSSRGPRLGGGLKPDIAAPGVAITAARAAGTAMGTPVDDRYTSANGTSMATPHVSGAAAILAGQHPDWSPARLKAALMSTSRDTGANPYEQGAGRVDLTRAVGQPVLATTSALDFGNVADAPDDPADPVSRQIELTNSGSEPVTLTLRPTLRSITGEPVADGVLTADETVTVPAGGTAAATVTLAAGGITPTDYAGTVVATDEASGTRLSTPVAVTVEPPKVTLTIRTIGRDGAQMGELPLEHGGSMGGWSTKPSQVTAFDVPGVGSISPDVVTIEPGLQKVRVQPGNYTVSRQVFWWDDTKEDYVVGMLFDGQVGVTGDTEITLDARTAKPLTWTLPRATVGEVSHSFLGVDIGRWDGQLLTSTSHADYVTPTEKVTAGTFRVGFKLEEHKNPQVSLTMTRPDRTPIPVEPRSHADEGLAFGRELGSGEIGTRGGWVPFPAGRRSLQLVDAGYGDPADLAGLDLRGKLALVRWGDDRFTPGVPTSVIWTDRIDNLQRAGAVGWVTYADPPGAKYARHASFSSPTGFHTHWIPAGPKEIRIPEVQVKRSVGRMLTAATARGPVTVEVQSDPTVRYAYHAHVYAEQQIPADLHFALSAKDFVQVDSRLHSAQATGRAKMSTSSWKPGTYFSSPRDTMLGAPKAAFTEYYGPIADDVRWTRRLKALDFRFGDVIAEPRVFDRSDRIAEDWNVGLVTPGPVVLRTFDMSAHPPPAGSIPVRFVGCTLCRQGNTLIPWRAKVSGEGQFAEGLTAALRVFDAAGTEIPRSTRDGAPVFDLPPTPGRLSATLNEGTVSTRWEFRSAPPTTDTTAPYAFCFGLVAGWTEPCAPEPLVYLTYDLSDSQRLDNSVPARPVHRFTVRAFHSQSTTAAPRIAGLKLWTSTDGGTTWRQASVIPRGRDVGGERSFDVVALYGARPGGTVSLKAEAWDAAGNRIQQVVKDAVKLS